MPHCILEYSSNLPETPDPKAVLTDVNTALDGTGLFALADIKSRAVRHDDFVIGDGKADRTFVTLNVQILEGRDEPTREMIAERMLDVLRRHFPRCLETTLCSLTVQISGIDRASYRKEISY